MPALPGRPQCVGDQRQRAAEHGGLDAFADRLARGHALERQQQHQHAGQRGHAEAVVDLGQQAEAQAEHGQQQQPQHRAVHAEVGQHAGQQQPGESAGHAQRAEAEGAAEIRLEHDRGGHRDPVAVRDRLPACEQHRQAQAHAAAQGMPERDRAEAEVGAQGLQRRQGTQRRRQPGLGQLGLDLAAAAGPVAVAHQRAQLPAHALHAGHGDAQQAPLAGVRGLRLRLRQRVGQIVEAGHRGLRRGRVLGVVQRVGELVQHHRAAFQHALDQQPRGRHLVQAPVQVGQGQQFQPRAFAQLGDDPERLHRQPARAMLAVQHHHRLEHRLGSWRCQRRARPLAGDAGQLAHQFGQREPLRAVALQRPGGQRHQHLQHAAGEDQRGHADALRRR